MYYIKLTLIVVGKDYVDCCVEEPGELGGRMLWTIPRLILKEPKLSVQDKQELDFALEHHVIISILCYVIRRYCMIANEITLH